MEVSRKCHYLWKCHESVTIFQSDTKVTLIVICNALSDIAYEPHKGSYVFLTCSDEDISAIWNNSSAIHQSCLYMIILAFNHPFGSTIDGTHAVIDQSEWNHHVSDFETLESSSWTLWNIKPLPAIPHPIWVLPAWILRTWPQSPQYWGLTAEKSRRYSTKTVRYPWSLRPLVLLVVCTFSENAQNPKP